MKAKYVFLSMLSCGLLAACNNDENIAEESASTNFSGAEAYVKVKIAMSNGASTRATSGGYENGSTEEQAIKSIRFAFYDDNDNFVALGREVNNTITVTPTTDGDNVEGIAEAVVALEIEEGQELPTKVVAFVNATPSEIASNNYFSVRALTTDEIGNATDGFVMTSSTYWSNGEQIATDVAPTDFYETEAMATASENPVDIYVERLAAKVTVKEDEDLDGNIEDLEDANGNTLSFTLEGYALNGLNKTEYYLKHLQDDWSSWTWAWNNATDHRSFWAEDPNYDDMNGTTLEFVSYNDVTAYDGEAQYCMENTLTYDLYESAGYEACTHVLVVGSYEVTGDGSVDEDGSFYMYGGIAYSTESIMNILANNGLVFTRTENGTGEYVYTSADPDAYKLVRIEGTNEETLALTEVEGTTYYTKDDSGAYVEITDYTAFNETLAAAVGGAEKYSEGKAYFAVAIEHLGNEGEDGSIGVVRNHSYQLTLQSIKGLGEGVYDPDEDIIPSVSTDTYYVGATLNILSWHVVSQDVNL